MITTTQQVKMLQRKMRIAQQQIIDAGNTRDWNELRQCEAVLERLEQAYFTLPLAARATTY